MFCSCNQNRMSSNWEKIMENYEKLRQIMGNKHYAAWTNEKWLSQRIMVWGCFWAKMQEKSHILL